MTDELLDQFVLEGRELVQQAFDDLTGIERDGPDPERVDRAFRAVHTLKGSAGLFDFAPLGAMLHTAEDRLSGLRDGAVMTPGTMTALLDCIAAADGWIEAVARTGTLPDDAGARSRMLIGALTDGLGAETGAAPSADPGRAAPGWLHALLMSPGTSEGAALAHSAVRYVPSADCFFLGEDPLGLVRSIPDLLALEIATREPWPPAAAFDPFRCNLVITAASRAPVEQLRTVFRLVPDQVEVVPVAARAGPAPGDIAPEPPSEPGTRTLRIEAGRIDALADLVGELFVAKNRLAHLAAEAEAVAPGFARALASHQAEIERLAGDMHRAVMSARMTPLGQTLRRLPLLVREIAAKLGKEVRLTVEGAGTEADKTLVDGVFEPLLHVLRNAVDHGIETPEVRRAAGKPESGHIALRAGREGEQVVITVADDGAGIDRAALRRAVGRRGQISPADLDVLDDAGLLDLIFLPGISTAAAVTDVSGRGVGMDAVRAALQAMGGRVGIEGAPGQGTTVRFTVPQAVAVTPILIVEAAGERFGVPIEVVTEMARVPRAAILPVRAGAAFVLRERTIPLLRLADLLGRPGPRAGGEAKILVVAAGGHRVGIEIDGLGQRMDVVLRPLHGLLAGLPGLRGAALTGDGRVLLVLDVPALAA